LLDHAGCKNYWCRAEDGIHAGVEAQKLVFQLILNLWRYHDLLAQYAQGSGKLAP
jgi:hypothetical protein